MILVKYESDPFPSGLSIFPCFPITFRIKSKIFSMVRRAQPDLTPCFYLSYTAYPFSLSGNNTGLPVIPLTQSIPLILESVSPITHLLISFSALLRCYLFRQAFLNYFLVAPAHHNTPLSYYFIFF